MRAKLVVFVVPVLMVLAAVAHGWRVNQFGESPWIGAGFGMFAEIDGPQRVTALELADGETIVDPVRRDSLARAANFPSKAALEKVVGTSPQIVDIEIYRPVFEHGRVSWEVVASLDD